VDRPYGALRCEPVRGRLRAELSHCRGYGESRGEYSTLATHVLTERCRVAMALPETPDAAAPQARRVVRTSLIVTAAVGPRGGAQLIGAESLQIPVIANDDSQLPGQW
jgi:hypothetical protein